jgi:hypothetical protein
MFKTFSNKYALAQAQTRQVNSNMRHVSPPRMVIGNPSRHDKKSIHRSIERNVVVPSIAWLSFDRTTGHQLGRLLRNIPERAWQINVSRMLNITPCVLCKANAKKQLSNSLLGPAL